MKKRIMMMALVVILLLAGGTALGEGQPLAMDNLQVQGRQAPFFLSVYREGEGLVLYIQDMHGKVTKSSTALRQDGRVPSLTWWGDMKTLEIHYKGDFQQIPEERYRFILQPENDMLTFQTALITWTGAQIRLSVSGDNWVVLDEYDPYLADGYIQLLSGMELQGLRENLPLAELPADALAAAALDYRHTWRAQAIVQQFPEMFERLKLREEPSASARVLGQYFSGTVIDRVISRGPEWTKVQIGSREGYMMSRFLRYDALIPIWTQTARFGGHPGKVVQYAEGTSLYRNPDTNSPVLGQIPKGRIVAVLGTVGEDWLHVVWQPGYEVEDAMLTPGNRWAALPAVYGFASSRDIGMTDNMAECYVQTKRPQDKLHLRAEPSTGARSLGMYFYDTAFQLLFDDHVIGGDFERVRIGDRVGYVMKSLLSYRSAGLGEYLPPLTSAARQTPLLAKAGENADVLEQLSKGQPLQVLGTAGEYYHVKTSPDWTGTLGYVLQKDVKRVSQAVPARVTLKNGTRLYYVSLEDGKLSPAAGVDEMVKDVSKLKAWVYTYIGADQRFPGFVQTEIEEKNSNWISGCWVRVEDLKFDQGLVWQK